MADFKLPKGYQSAHKIPVSLSMGSCESVQAGSGISFLYTPLPEVLSVNTTEMVSVFTGITDKEVYKQIEHDWESR